MSGNSDIFSLFEKWQQGFAKFSSPQVIMVESQRIASAGSRVKERGSLKDRLEKTDEEAMARGAADNIQDGKPVSNEDITDEQEDALIDKAVEKILEDFVNNTLLQE